MLLASKTDELFGDKMMNKLITTTLIGSLALGGFGYAIASGDNKNEHSEHHGEKYCKHGEGHKSGHHKKGMGHRLERMSRHLELSDEQKTKIESIFKKYSEQLSSLREEKRNNRKMLREKIHEKKQDVKEIEKLAKKQGDAFVRKIMTKAKMKSEIISILTDEQLEKMQTMRGKRGHHKHG